MKRFQGQVALVTGGARGIGAATVRRLANEGAAVVISDVLDAEGQELAAEIRRAEGRAVYEHLDVTSEEEWRRAVDRAATLGKLTVLVKRNPALSVEEFHAEWRAHGRMIADEPVFAEYVRRYEQHHRVLADYGAPLYAGEEFDGMAVQWFDSFKDFMAMLQTPEYAAKMQPDEDRILDLPKMVVMITEEPEVFIGA